MALGDANAEGVIVQLPVPQTGAAGGTASVRAKRYSSRDKVPLLERGEARQMGRAGFWYVPIGDTARIWWDKITDQAWAIADRASDTVNDALGADRGILGIFSKLLGIPYPLSVVLVLFVGYALLRGAGLVPPIRGVMK